MVVKEDSNVLVRTLHFDVKGQRKKGMPKRTQKKRAG